MNLFSFSRELQTVQRAGPVSHVACSVSRVDPLQATIYLKAAHPGPGLNLKSNFFRRVNRNEVT